ncbi:MAG: hypothetical protein ACHQ0J_05160 [Candidatus Dormibacterales bacterium]
MASQFRISIPASQAEAQRVNSAAVSLDRFVSASSQTWGTQSRAQPIVGSPYAEACRLAKGRWAFDFARFHLAGAEDHLMTVAVILGTGWLPTYAWYGLLRSCLEASARACWLLDPTLTPRQRQSRGFTEHLTKVRGDLAFARPPRRPAIRLKIEALRDEAKRQGIPESFGKPPEAGAPKPLVGFGIKRPGPSRLLLEALPDELAPDDDPEGQFLYHIVSGPAHSEPWALILPVERVGPVEDGITTAKVEVKLGALMPVIEKAVELHDRAVRWHTQLMGYDEKDWEAARGALTRF